MILPLVARDWVRQGFTRLHVVDLDAATGRGHNTEVIREILRDAGVPVQVGGGVRDEATASSELLDEGADWVVVGTRAVEDDRLARGDGASLPGQQLIVAADVRERKVVTKGGRRRHASTW
jgi:phosphoribosylformimino-5-aminoimidazole carboxamide ribotide isomerase